MTDKHTQEELEFYVNRWLSEKQDDKQLMRECAVLRKDEPVKPGKYITLSFILNCHVKYTVEVVPLHTYIVWFVIV